jgi:hypothetical protein
VPPSGVTGAWRTLCGANASQHRHACGGLKSWHELAAILICGLDREDTGGQHIPISIRLSWYDDGRLQTSIIFKMNMLWRPGDELLWTFLDCDKPLRTEILVAPQGFTSAENKRHKVTHYFAYPHLYPHKSGSLSDFPKLALGFP